MSELPRNSSSDLRNDRTGDTPGVTGALIALLLIYLILLIVCAQYSVIGSDSSGYANLARSLLNGQIKVPVREIKVFEVDEKFSHVFTPLGYTNEMKDGRVTAIMLPFYPIGLPLHEVLGVLILGWRYGPFVISPILAVLSCWFLYSIGRLLGLSRLFASLGPLLLAINPTFIFLAQQPMSDGPSTFWGLLVIWAGLRSRESRWWMVLAGFAFGTAFLLRPTNVLFLVPLTFCIPIKPRAIALFALGGLPLAAVFLHYNYQVFGNPFSTGYESIGLLDRFDLTGVGRRFKSYAYWMAVTLSPIVLGGWLVSAFLRDVHWRSRALLVSWLVPFLALYSFYDFYDAWWYTRFLLPAYPALLLGTLLTARWLTTRLVGYRRTVRWAVWAIAGLVLLWVPLKYVVRHDLLYFGQSTRIQREICQWTDTQLPPKGVVISWEMSGALHFYTDRLIVRYERLDPSFWPLLRTRIVETGHEFFALLMDSELDLAKRNIPGHWVEMGRRGHIALWRVDPLGEVRP